MADVPIVTQVTQLNISCGTECRFVVTAVDSDNGAPNLTGLSATLTIYDGPAGPGFPLLTKTSTAWGAAGRSVVALTAAETAALPFGTWRYTLRQTIAAGVFELAAGGVIAAIG
jgi:hypothetical protein